MKDLKHMIYFEKLLDSACNDLVREAQKENRVAVGFTCFHIPEVLLNLTTVFLSDCGLRIWVLQRLQRIIWQAVPANFPEHCWNGQSRADFSFWMRLPGLISVNA